MAAGQGTGRPAAPDDGRGGRRGRSAARPALLVLAAALLAPAPAAARLTQADLARVVVAPAPGARVPLERVFTEAGPDAERSVTLGQVLDGRPTLLLPVDYTCGNVCDPMLSLSAAALAATGLAAGRDYGFVLVGLDPRDAAAAARRMLAADPGADAARPRALVGSEAAVAALTGALGYGFVPDPATDSIAHPAAAILLTPEGRVARVLSPLALNGRDLRLALVEAGEGRTGGLGDRLALLCYGFDPAKGIYTPLVRRILALAGAATVAGIALLVLVLARRGRVRGA